MIGFHIDMNVAQYRADYLARWLAELARLGFDTVLWEVENAIAWETCPECVSPDAFSKDTFRAILAQCRSLGLEPIPLLQTIGHAEYVLKHGPYRDLRELPSRIDQYCPRNPDVLPFLHSWIDEYLELFGDVATFHIGADEARALGSCPECRKYAERHSLSALYIDHVNAVAEPLTARGVTPAIWADMVLHHNEALDTLSREIVLFDWMYDIYRGNGKVWVWGEGMRGKSELGAATMGRFGRTLFPDGDEPGREPETFYTADFLAHEGFRVITCPSASSYGDNVFSPRNWLHVANTFDSFSKGASAHLCGSVLTSWSQRLHPWELQLACIGIPGFLAAYPRASLEEYPAWFVREAFGVDDTGFWQACGLLSKSCLFTHSGSLGFGKACLPVAEDHVHQTLLGLQVDGRLEAEAEACCARAEEYRRALQQLRAFACKAERGFPYLEVWDLAARNLINRASVSRLLLAHADEVIETRALYGAPRDQAACLLGEHRALRQETDELYARMIRPSRRAEMIEYMYGVVERALEGLAGAAVAGAKVAPV